MVSLNLKDSIFFRAAGTTHLFKILKQRGEFGPYQRKPRHGGDRLTTPTLCFSAHAHVTVTYNTPAPFLGTAAREAGLVAHTTHLTVLSGVHQSETGIFILGQRTPITVATSSTHPTEIDAHEL
jgi:hypothetical protein